MRWIAAFLPFQFFFWAAIEAVATEPPAPANFSLPREEYFDAISLPFCAGMDRSEEITISANPPPPACEKARVLFQELHEAAAPIRELCRQLGREMELISTNSQVCENREQERNSKNYFPIFNPSQAQKSALDKAGALKRSYRQAEERFLCKHRILMEDPTCGKYFKVAELFMGQIVSMAANQAIEADSAIKNTCEMVNSYRIENGERILDEKHVVRWRKEPVEDYLEGHKKETSPRAREFIEASLRHRVACGK